VLAIGPRALAEEQPERSIPPGIVTLEDFEAVARQRLDPQTFEIVRGGAADELTLRWNREAFERVQLRPHVLVDVSRLTTGLTLFDQTLASPILLAPAGVHGLLHPDGELETGRGAAKSNAVLVIPSSPARPVEEIARVTGQAPWYQLYVGRDRGATRDEAQRAEKAGSTVLFVTVDGGSRCPEWHDAAAVSTAGDARGISDRIRS
jgi:4-hydroxymandelate oxidase